MIGQEYKLQYRDMCAIGRQTARIVEQVPKEKLLIALLDDLIKDPEAFHRKATKFIGVNYSPPTSDAIVNPSKHNHSPSMARLIRWSKFINHPRVRAIAPLYDSLKEEIDILENLLDRSLDDWRLQ